MISIGELSGTMMDLLSLEGRRALVTHLGDGKVVVFDRERRLTFETEDHNQKARREFEWLRVEKIRITKKMISGMIAMSRSIRDASIAGILHVPDFHELLLSEKDRWVVIRCDGLWNDMDFPSIGKTLLKSNSTMDAAKLLRDQALSRGSDDNDLASKRSENCHRFCEAPESARLTAADGSGGSDVYIDNSRS
jgi:serine/threonine protein phosphatase PrpC